MRENGEPRREPRLKSWKEIAAFFGADERTVKRWEKSRGLPVRRIPGGGHGTVYADIDELEAWLRGGHREPPTPNAEPLPERASSRHVPAAIGLLIASAAILALTGLGWTARARPAHQPPAHALDLYLAGTYFWEQRTAESLPRALRLFGEAIAEDPAYAEAYAGLANSYLLMREYTALPDAKAYPRAEAAAAHALKLNDGLAEAHAALAFVKFYWERDIAGALSGFERAIALDPQSARNHQWYANALLQAGESRRALEQIDLAQRLNPHSRSILSDKGISLYYIGRRREGIALLRQVAAAEPDFQSPHAYLAAIHLRDGDYPAWLAEARTAARLRDDAPRLALLAAAEKGLKESGSRGLLGALLAGQEKMHQAGEESAYALASTHAMLGNRQAAMRALEAALAANEAAMLGLAIDPIFRALRGDAAFDRLVARSRRPAQPNRKSA